MMTLAEIERTLRALRLSGIAATLNTRVMEAQATQQPFLETLSAMLQDELDRRRSRLLDRRYALSGLPERCDLKSFDWSYNPRLPRRDVLELATLKFIDAREDALLIGPPGTGKSHVAKALAALAVAHGRKVIYREATSSSRTSPRRASWAKCESCAPSSRPPNCSSSTTSSCANSPPTPATSSPTC